MISYMSKLNVCDKPEGKGKFLKELKQCRENILLYVIYNSSTNNQQPVSGINNASNSMLNQPSLRVTRSATDDQLSTANYSLESFWATMSTRVMPNNAPASTGPTNTNTDHNNNNNNNNEPYPYINSLLADFRRKIIEIQDNTSFYGQDCVIDSKWSLFSAILFTITTISTVGYGFIAPLTWEGRVVCVCYASMGIPIFLM